MPMPIYLAHKASKRLTEVRKSGILPYLRPDGKTQFTVKYEDNTPVGIDCVLISSQHGENVTHDQIERDIIEFVAILKIFNKDWVCFAPANCPDCFWMWNS